MPADILEFERVVGPSDLRVSRPITTPAGDRIRVVSTVSGSAVITPARGADPDLDVLVVTGLEDGAIEKEETGFWGKLWDALKTIGKEVGKAVLDGGGGGGGCKPETITRIEVGPGGRITGITITTKCN